PGALHGSEFWRAHAFELRGGVLGQGELWVSMHLFSTVGAHVLAVFLFLAGVILLTGAGVATSAGTLKRSTEEGHRRLSRWSATVAAGPPALETTRHDEPLLPPEPDTSELVVRATHVEA